MKKHPENRAQHSSDVWLTPRHITEPLGKFDLDPCHLPDGMRPWDTAQMHYNERQDGLRQPWFGRVWLNPPYGGQQIEWIKRLAEHGNGIVLLAARTETFAFHEIWMHADGVLFLPKRVQFCTATGELPEASAPGFPVALAAFGKNNVTALKNSPLGGALVEKPLWLGDGRLGKKEQSLSLF